MTKTVKELIIKIKQEIKLYNSALSLRTLENLINKYENELAEKDRKIDLLLTANKQITYSTKGREYNQQQLYKEDFGRPVRWIGKKQFLWDCFFIFILKNINLFALFIG